MRSPSPWHRPLLHGWRGLLVLAAVVVVGTTALVGSWYLSEGDLRGIERDMAAAGLATTWSALEVPDSVPRDPVIERLIALSAGLTPWTPDAPARTQPQPGQPLPPSLHAWSAALVTADLAEADRLVATLPPQRVFMIHESEGWYRGWLNAWKNLVTTTGQRLALAPPDEVPTNAC